MREIEFRGKTKDGKFVYGDLLNYKNGIKTIINKTDESVIIPETIGQYTGLKDKNGNKIFEGDVLSTDCDDKSFDYLSINFHVVFFEGSYCLEYNGNTQGRSPLSKKRALGLVIIGNIYENPEMEEE